MGLEAVSGHLGKDLCLWIHTETLSMESTQQVHPRLCTSSLPDAAACEICHSFATTSDGYESCLNPTASQNQKSASTSPSITNPESVLPPPPTVTSHAPPLSAPRPRSCQHTHLISPTPSPTIYNHLQIPPPSADLFIIANTSIPSLWFHRPFLSLYPRSSPPTLSPPPPLFFSRIRSPALSIIFTHPPIHPSIHPIRSDPTRRPSIVGGRGGRGKGKNQSAQCRFSYGVLLGTRKPYAFECRVPPPTPSFPVPSGAVREPRPNFAFGSLDTPFADCFLFRSLSLSNSNSDSNSNSNGEVSATGFAGVRGEVFFPFFLAESWGCLCYLPLLPPPPPPPPTPPPRRGGGAPLRPAGGGGGGGGGGFFFSFFGGGGGGCFFFAFSPPPPPPPRQLCRGRGCWSFRRHARWGKGGGSGVWMDTGCGGLVLGIHDTDD